MLLADKVGQLVGDVGMYFRHWDSSIDSNPLTQRRKDAKERKGKIFKLFSV
jgi:hypothetical protein